MSCFGHFKIEPNSQIFSRIGTYRSYRYLFLIVGRTGITTVFAIRIHNPQSTFNFVARNQNRVVCYLTLNRFFTMNDYDAYDDDYVDSSHQNNNVANDMLPLTDEHQPPEVDFDDPSIAALPRVLLMGPRRAGKTSIQVRHIYTNTCTM